MLYQYIAAVFYLKKQTNSHIQIIRLPSLDTDTDVPYPKTLGNGRLRDTKKKKTTTTTTTYAVMSLGTVYDYIVLGDEKTGC